MFRILLFLVFIFFAAAVLFLENRNLVKLYGGPRLQTNSFETDQIEVSPQKRSRLSKPFDPFSDFRKFGQLH